MSVAHSSFLDWVARGIRRGGLGVLSIDSQSAISKSQMFPLGGSFGFVWRGLMGVKSFTYRSSSSKTSFARASCFAPSGTFSSGICWLGAGFDSLAAIPLLSPVIIEGKTREGISGLISACLAVPAEFPSASVHYKQIGAYQFHRTLHDTQYTGL